MTKKLKLDQVIDEYLSVNRKSRILEMEIGCKIDLAIHMTSEFYYECMSDHPGHEYLEALANEFYKSRSICGVPITIVSPARGSDGPVIKDGYSIQIKNSADVINRLSGIGTPMHT